MGGEAELGALRRRGSEGVEEGRDGGGPEVEAGSEGDEGAEGRHCGRGWLCMLSLALGLAEVKSNM